MRLGNILAEQFELMGLFGVDFVLEGERVWSLEVNPRYTASVEIVERFTGVSAIAKHAEMFFSAAKRANSRLETPSKCCLQLRIWKTSRRKARRS